MARAVSMATYRKWLKYCTDLDHQWQDKFLDRVLFKMSAEIFSKIRLSPVPLSLADSSCNIQVIHYINSKMYCLIGYWYYSDSCLVLECSMLLIMSAKIMLYLSTLIYWGTAHLVFCYAPHNTHCRVLLVGFSMLDNGRHQSLSETTTCRIGLNENLV